jgi:hypothetical protein
MCKNSLIFVTLLRAIKSQNGQARKISVDDRISFRVGSGAILRADETVRLDDKLSNFQKNSLWVKLCCHLPGTDIVILKIFSPKNSAQNWRF